MGENGELHDHWVDSFDVVTIPDYVSGEDHIAVIGHARTMRADISLSGQDLRMHRMTWRWDEKRLPI